MKDRQEFRRRREAASLSQDRIAQVAPIDQSNVSRFEDGSRKLSEQTRERLWRALHELIHEKQVDAIATRLGRELLAATADKE